MAEGFKLKGLSRKSEGLGFRAWGCEGLKLAVKRPCLGHKFPTGWVSVEMFPVSS